MMRPELQLLMARLADESPDAEGGNTVSFNAHRDAERLRDASLVNELANYVAAEPNRKKRQHAYFIIGKIGANLRDVACAEVLIKATAREENKYVLSGILQAIAEIPKPVSVDISQIFLFLSDARWLVRRAAIAALRNTSSPEAESRLIELLSGARDIVDMVYCNATLGCIGSTKAILPIAANLKSRKRDLKISAEIAIEKIQARNALP